MLHLNTFFINLFQRSYISDQGYDKWIGCHGNVMSTTQSSQVNYIWKPLASANPLFASQKSETERRLRDYITISYSLVRLRNHITMQNHF